MKIVIFQGGLGNQIFQYFFYQYVKTKISKCVLGVVRDGNNHNGFELIKYFDVKPKMPQWLYGVFRIYEKYKVRLPHFIQDVYIKEPNEKGSCSQFIYDGYWQNRRYLDKTIIKFRNLPLSDRNKTIEERMLSSNSVAIHVRRGDYLLPPHCNLFANICTIEYYKEAIDLCRQHLNNAQFYFFSDDMEWVKQNLYIDNAYYIDWNKGDDSIFDMYLMSLAKINVIANSTFSFWAAFLNYRNILVVYPKRWFNNNSGISVPDIFPKDWVGLVPKK